MFAYYRKLRAYYSILQYTTVYYSTLQHITVPKETTNAHVDSVCVPTSDRRIKAEPGTTHGKHPCAALPGLLPS